MKNNVRESVSADGCVKEQNMAEVALLPAWVISLFAVTCGLAVANVYFAQPLLDAMAESFGVPVKSIGMVITVTQIGYVLGLFFLVPLGDLFERRMLIISMLLLCSAALVMVGFAPDVVFLLLGLAIVGLMAVVVQVLVAYAATVSAPEQRGKAVGTVTSGVVLGILLARVVAGFLADMAGWRSVYFLSAGLLSVVALILLNVIPAQVRANKAEGYWQLLTSLFGLFFSLRVLRIRAGLAFLIFMSFSILWTSLVLPLSTGVFSLTHTQVGLFGLAGIAGALAASKAGMWADKGLGRRTTYIALWLLMMSWLFSALLGSSLLFLVAGILLLDFAVQAVHVTSQSRIFAVCPQANSRLVAAYMIFYSAGSGAGAIASTQVYAKWGWSGVCIMGFLVSAAALIFWIITERGERQSLSSGQ